MKSLLIAFVLALLTTSVQVEAMTDTLDITSCEGNAIGLSQTVCEEVQKLPKSEQKETILHMLGQGDITMNEKKHIVDGWNSRLKATADPPSTSSPLIGGDAFGHQVIEGWVLAATVMPSFKKEGVYYTPENFEVMALYNYTISMPPSDSGCGEKTLEKDWEEFTGFSAATTVKVNGNDVSIEEEGSIRAESSKEGEQIVQLTVDVTLNYIRHYWITYTVNLEGGGTDIVWECKDETKSHSTSATNYDTITPIKIYNSKDPNAKLRIIGNKAKPTIDAGQYSLQVGDANLTLSRINYHINYSHEPYNVFEIVQKNATIKYFSKGLDVLKTNPLTIEAKNYNNPEVTVFHPFSQEGYPVDVSFAYEPELTISLDKNTYKSEEEMEVTVVAKTNGQSDQGRVFLHGCNETQELQLQNGQAKTIRAACPNLKASFTNTFNETAAEYKHIGIEKSFTNIVVFIVTLGLLVFTGKAIVSEYWRRSI